MDSQPESWLLTSGALGGVIPRMEVAYYELAATLWGQHRDMTQYHRE